MNSDEIELVQTCGACPEQYDAKINGETLGYLRLRHGSFTVECPNVGGDMVYAIEAEGDGIFEGRERGPLLFQAKMAIVNYHNRRASED